MSAVEPCGLCGAAGFRTVGAWMLCRRHWLSTHLALNPGVGRGMPVGRSEAMPPGDWDLFCEVCSATWVGPELAVCPWCVAREAARVAIGAPDFRPAGDTALVCDVCGWRWNGLHAQGCRRDDGVVCNGRGSFELAQRAMRGGI